MANDRIKAAVCNNMGRVRRNNEDNFYLAGKYMQLGEMDNGGLFTFEGIGTQIFAVCDGMGGGEAGEEASFMVVDELDKAIKSGEIRSAASLRRLFQNTSNSVHRKHSAVSGSTLALLAVNNGHVFISNIGDSRIYRLRNGRFKQISLDHVGFQAHSITQYIGMEEDDPLEPHERMDDVGEWTIGVDMDTTYLLCSDGLTDMVPNNEIRDTLLAFPEPKDAAQRLVDMALAKGGRDNVTVMVVRVPQEMSDTPKKHKLGFLLGLIGVSIPLFFVLIEILLRIVNKAG